jgi:ribosomal protein L18
MNLQMDDARENKSTSTQEAAFLVGTNLAKKAIEKNISKIEQQRWKKCAYF